MDKKITRLIILFLVLISLFIGFYLGKTLEKKIWEEKLAKTQGELAKSQKESSWFESLLERFYPSLPQELNSLTGKITKIEDKAIWIEAEARVSRFPLPEGAEIEKQDIKVIIADQTYFSKYEVLRSPPTPEKPCLPGEKWFEEKPISFEGLKVGDNVLVGSKENIIGKKEITASQIQVIVQDY